ncbi:helix-turn-helix transcriptional regulator [Parasedimentitalea maritima]|uniref:Helix-turn-helix transcriptional regulator n=1 Tax=Parasedimentitalea maritima TaxID=2578117 RepID=A0ABY2UT10_9RHOB|nr:helix-turn-helix domain-containing protein [Zongyanglinia marina]TLP61383.1 helix-turn-helix transcriptional regulator [Zongyanglinia marina]
MTKKTKIRQTGCPVAFGLDIFGDRWTLLVIREIMLRGKRTYSEFMEMEEEIATNILIDRLKALEAEGLVDKTRDPENRRSFLYALTKKGRDLAPILLEIIIWSGAHDARSFALTDVLEKIKADRDGFEHELRSERENLGDRCE